MVDGRPDAAVADKPVPPGEPARAGEPAPPGRSVPAGEPAPPEDMREPTGLATTIPTFGFLLLVLIVVVALGVIGGALGLALALLVLLAGLPTLAGIGSSLGRTRSSALRVRPTRAGLHGQSAPAAAAAAGRPPARYDLPPGSPAARRAPARRRSPGAGAGAVAARPRWPGDHPAPTPRRGAPR